MGFLRDNRHPNRKRLEENQKENLDSIEQILDSKNSDIIDVNVNLRQIKFDDFTLEKVTNVIMQLHDMLDDARNIELYETINSDGTKNLIRDARKVKPVEKEIENTDPRAVLQQMASSTRAALHMIDVYKGQLGEDEYNKVKGRLNVLFNEEIKKFDANNPGDIKALKNYNANILYILREERNANEEGKSQLSKVQGLDISKDIGTTMHTMNLVEDKYHMSTISEGPNNSIIVESNIMLLGVTEEQERQLVALRNNDQNTLKDLKWYQTLASYERSLVRFAANQILNDKNEVVKPIPTQLRNLMPFAKNGYYGVDHLKQQDKDIETISSANRNGAIYLGIESEDRAEQNIETVKQLNTFTPTINTPILQVNLTSPNNPTGHEKEATRQIREAFLATGNFTNTTPFNSFRKLMYSDTSGYQNFLDELARANTGVMPRLKDVSNYLKTGNGKQAALKVLKKEYNRENVTQEQKDYLDMMKVAVDAKSLMSKRIPFYEIFGNDNLKLFEYFSELNTAIQHETGSIRKIIDNSNWSAKETLPKMLNEIAAFLRDHSNESNLISDYLEGKAESSIDSAKLFISRERNNKDLDNDYTAYIDTLDKAIDTREKLNQLLKIENLIDTETLRITNRDSIKDLVTVRNYVLYGKGSKSEAISALENLYEKNPKVHHNSLINAIEMRASLGKITAKNLFQDLHDAMTKEARPYATSQSKGDNEKNYEKKATYWYEKMSSIAVNCMSGKDRAGIAAFRKVVTAIARKLGFKSSLANENSKDNQEEITNIEAKLKDTGQQKILPSRGNDAGTYGVMPNSRWAETCSKENSLTCETARTNKFTASKNPTVNLEDLDKVFQANQQATKDQHGPYTNSAIKEHVQEMNEKQNKGNPDKKQTKGKSGLTK